MSVDLAEIARIRREHRRDALGLNCVRCGMAVGWPCDVVKVLAVLDGKIAAAVGRANRRRRAAKRRGR